MTEKELYEILSEDLKCDFARYENGEIGILELAKKYEQTYRRNKKEYVKATFINFYAAWTKYKE